MERRKYLGGTVSLLTVGLAGCAGDSLDASLNETSSTSGLEESGSDSNTEAGSDSSPEAVVEAFLRAAEANNIEKQETLLHEESVGVEPITDDLDLTINEITTRTLEEIANKRDQSVSEDGFEATRRKHEDEADSIGASDYSYVYFDIGLGDAGFEEGYMHLVKDDGEWLIYKFGSVAFEEATSEEPSQETVSRLQVLAITGNVSENETIDELNLTVTKAPVGDDIDLEEVSYEFVTADSVTADVVTTDQISVVTAETEDNVITDQSDRYTLTFVTATHLDGELEAGDEVATTLTTAEGGSAVTQLRVPDSLVDRDAVTL